MSCRIVKFTPTYPGGLIIEDNLDQRFADRSAAKLNKICQARHLPYTYKVYANPMTFEEKCAEQTRWLEEQLNPDRLRN
jgi:hypothetical protein